MCQFVVVRRRLSAIPRFGSQVITQLPTSAQNFQLPSDLCDSAGVVKGIGSGPALHQLRIGLVLCPRRELQPALVQRGKRGVARARQCAVKCLCTSFSVGCRARVHCLHGRFRIEQRPTPVRQLEQQPSPARQHAVMHVRYKGLHLVTVQCDLMVEHPKLAPRRLGRCAFVVVQPARRLRHQYRHQLRCHDSNEINILILAGIFGWKERSFCDFNGALFDGRCTTVTTQIIRTGRINAREMAT